MSDVTRVLNAIGGGDRHAAAELLPLIYEELRKLAAQKLSSEPAGQTLQATALVHEAYVRLVSGDQRWDHRGHFFAAAAEAMRRILIENARRKQRLKYGGERDRVELMPDMAILPEGSDRLIELDAALTELTQEDPVAGKVVQLHFFGGLPLEQVGELLGMSRATVYRQWAYARSWLKCALDNA